MYLPFPHGLDCSKSQNHKLHGKHEPSDFIYFAKLFLVVLPSWHALISKLESLLCDVIKSLLGFRSDYSAPKDTMKEN